MKISNPFPGLRPYGADVQSPLFGRDGDLTFVMSRVLSSRATVLFAGSGVGKTSFLEAKLISELRDTFHVCWHQKWVGSSPLQLLCENLTGNLNEAAIERPTEIHLLPYFIAIANDKSNRPKRSLLVLDQFEEIFQYHKETQRLDDFIRELSIVVQSPDVDVRVLFSIREEFLGELSVFDNRLSDLFSNYYRLKNPDIRQTREIIRRTTESCTFSNNGNDISVRCDKSGLEALLKDLTTKGGTSIDGIYAAPVPLPYLQVVCNRIWQKTKPQPGGTPFLSQYTSGSAQQELRLYCRERLDHLTDRQRLVLADALGFLMTKRGAKMAYAVSDLAKLIQVDKRDLNATLRLLSGKHVRILRRFVDPDGHPWFELYHDMYAPLLMEWKAEFDIKRKRDFKEYTSGIRPKEVDLWEERTKPLKTFWVYLPNFLAEPGNKFFKTMLKNFTEKKTEYVYILQNTKDLTKLLSLIEHFEKKLKNGYLAAEFPVRQKVKFLLLGDNSNKHARALSGMLHLNNYWIANPGSRRSQGYEVKWDSSGRRVEAGIAIHAGKLRRIIRAMNSLFRAYPLQTLENMKPGDLSKLIENSPIRQIQAEIGTNSLPLRKGNA